MDSMSWGKEFWLMSSVAVLCEDGNLVVLVVGWEVGLNQ